ncbi:hypothetical protein GCM10017674_60380 [Streptomyces gardneri]|uniref:Uncharacterized protein n=1 Tax=Streptomyces gardneri TaxID=66892 RepID=A0A4Y3RN68_9ACTN|nr:hypothetical protein SGA01_28850 [Streptomyces gardneri]GHH13285.1 hypothetical protein GCM10017674_60380 [Streptomyces gardneri]
MVSRFERYGDLAELDRDLCRTRYGDIRRIDRILEAEGDTVNRYRVRGTSLDRCTNDAS